MKGDYIMVMQTRIFRFFLLIFAFIVSSFSSYAQDITIKDLGTLAGGYSDSEATAISNVGHIVGWSHTSAGKKHPVLWDTDGSLIDLGSLENDNSGRATSVNNFGVVVGWSRSGQYSTSTLGFLWTSEIGMQALSNLPSEPESIANDINDNNQIIGRSGHGNLNTYWYGVLWSEDGGIEKIDTPDYGSYDPFYRQTAINENGYIVGYGDSISGELHAFLWSPDGSIEDLGTLGGDLSVALDINDNGVVVGVSRIPSGYWHAFIWTIERGMVDIDPLGSVSSRALAVNNYGQVVGWSSYESGERKAFLWTEEEGIVDLGHLSSTNRESVATGINDLGQVVGWSEIDSGRKHAVLWNVRKDSDGDGIEDKVDEEPNLDSDRFSDKSIGGTTSGRIVHLAEGITIEITDAPDPDDGIRLVVLGPIDKEAKIKLDGSRGTLQRFTPGEYILTYNTITIEVINGKAKAEYDISGSPIIVGIEGKALIKEYVVGDKLEKISVNALDGVVTMNNEVVPEGEVLWVRSAEIDIKPDSYPNCFNSDGKGVIPIAILSSVYFDATQVEPSSISLNGQGVKFNGKGLTLSHFEDINNDSLDDIVAQIEDLDGIYDSGDTVATLTGRTVDNTYFLGTDTICIQP